MTKEHVVPDALGSNATIRMVCSKCNSVLGDSVDKPLAQFLGPLRVLDGIGPRRAGGRVSVPAWLRLKPDGTLMGMVDEQLRASVPPIQLVYDEKYGTHTAVFDARYTDPARTAVYLQSQGYRVVEGSLRPAELYPGALLGADIGSKLLLRGVGKVLLNFCARSYGLDAALDDEFDYARDFVRHGRGLPHAIFAAESNRDVFHRVVVAPNERNQCLGIVQFFGTMMVVVLVAQAWPNGWTPRGALVHPIKRTFRLFGDEDIFIDGNLPCF